MLELALLAKKQRPHFVNNTFILTGVNARLKLNAQINLPISNILTIIIVGIDMVFHAVNPLCRLKKT